MALLQNQTIFAQMPVKRRGGTFSDDRSLYGRADRRNVFASDAGWSAKSGIPSGHLHPSSWVLPRQAGGISSRNSSIGTATATGQLAAGRNIAGTSAGVATVAGTAQLVVSGQGLAAGQATVSGNITASRNGVGSAAGSSTATASITAKAWARGVSAGVGSAVAVRYATGQLVGSIAPAITLEASAFSAYLLDEEDVETGMTLRQALRLVVAATGGKVSGAGTTTITFRNALSDTKDRITATVDSSGNRTAITYDLA